MGKDDILYIMNMNRLLYHNTFRKALREGYGLQDQWGQVEHVKMPAMVATDRTYISNIGGVLERFKNLKILDLVKWDGFTLRRPTILDIEALEARERNSKSLLSADLGKERRINLRERLWDQEEYLAFKGAYTEK